MYADQAEMLANFAAVSGSNKVPSVQRQSTIQHINWHSLQLQV